MASIFKWIFRNYTAIGINEMNDLKKRIKQKSQRNLKIVFLEYVENFV